MKKIIISVILIFAFIPPINMRAQKLHSDNGDGTYTNPVIASDFPDPDVICVNGTYYMVNTTMFIFPGVTVLKSYDLVNWEYCSNAYNGLILTLAIIWMAATGTGMASGQRV